MCPYCGVGCELQVGTRDGRIVSVQPGARRAGQQGPPVRQGPLRVRVRRRRRPRHRADDSRRPRAGGRVTGTRRSRSPPIGCATLIARHGADSVGVLGSARATNEDNYLAQKFARVVLGTNNVDCCARVCHAPSAAGAEAGARRRAGDQLASTTSSAPARSSSAAPTRPRTTRSSARASSRRPAAARSSSSSIRGASSWPATPTATSQLQPGTEHPAAQRDGARHRRRGPVRPRVRRRAGSSGFDDVRAVHRRRGRPSARPTSAASTPTRSAHAARLYADERARPSAFTVSA